MQYINIYEYENTFKKFPFHFFTGGRGTGKTYSALDGALDRLENNGKFIYMRRTEDELETLFDDAKKGEGANPFKKINANKGVNFGITKLANHIGGVYHRQIEGDKLVHIGAPVGYALSLSTIAKIRGVDFSDCWLLIYDEFIKEKHIKAMKEEGEAFLNAIETINRNRELEGLPPIVVICLSNANDIYNPIFQTLGFVSLIERMCRKDKRDLYLEDRASAIHLLAPSEEFIEKKKQTALYKLAKGTRFSEMSLSNDFAYNDFSLISYRPIVQYAPICSIENKAFIYKKKGGQEIYVSYASSGTCANYKVQEKQDELRFRREQGVWLQPYFIKRKMVFESYELKELVLSLIL